MSLRLRIAGITAVCGLFVMTASGAALMAAFRADQEAAMTGVLEQQLDVLGPPALAAARQQRPRLEEFVEDRLLAPAIVRVWNQGSLVLATGAEGVDLGDPANEGLASHDDYRVLTRQFGVRPVATYTVQVAVSEAGSVAAEARLARTLRRVAGIAVVLLAAAGWLAASAALRPLQRLRTVTEGVAESSDLTRRLGSHETEPAEIREISKSFDSMMKRLEESSELRQRALDSARSFGAAAAHELRTPLTSLGANLEVLSAAPDHPNRSEILEEMAAEHSRLRRALEGLRLLAQGDVTGPEDFVEVDLVDLVGRVVAEVGRRHPEGVVNFEQPESEIRLMGWREGLNVMIENLLVNAMTHGRSADGTAKIRVSLTNGDGLITLTVEDAGPGVPESSRASVWEPFWRGPGRDVEGSGLGLALVAQQVRLHAGEVSIHSGSEGGARFEVRLPTP